LIFPLCNFHFPLLFSRNEKGLTLVELMIAIIIGTLLALTVGMIFLTTQSSWNEGWKKLNLQRDASIAMYRMERAIRAGKSVERPESWVLKVIDPDPTEPWKKFFRDGADLKYEKEGWEAPEIIINGKVNGENGLTFTVAPGDKKVAIDLKLKEDNLSANFVTTVKCRNP